MSELYNFSKSNPMGFDLNPLTATVNSDAQGSLVRSETFQGLAENDVDANYLFNNDMPPPDEENLKEQDQWIDPSYGDLNPQDNITEDALLDANSQFGKNFNLGSRYLRDWFLNKNKKKSVPGIERLSTPGQIEAAEKMAGNQESSMSGLVSASSSIDKAILGTPTIDEISDEDAGRFGIQFLGMNEHNLPFSGGVYAEVDNMPTEAAVALAGMLDLYDKLPMLSWSGSYRALKGVGLDPSTYFGGLAGLKFVKSLLAGGAKQAGKNILRDRILRKALGAGFVGVEGAGYAAMMDLFRQRQEAGDKPFVYDADKGLMATAMGFAAGSVLTGAITNAGAIGKVVTRVGKKANEIADSFIGDGNTLRMFAGPMSETADKAMLSQAKKMESDGLGRDAIWETTGWFKDKDKKWKYEISDRDSEFDFGELKGTQNVELNKALNHKELFKAYPWLENTPIGKKFMGSTLGSFNRDNKNISVSPVSNTKAGDAQSTVLHEIQHAIQEYEGFAKGTSPGVFRLGDSAREMTENELDLLKAWHSWAELKKGNPSASYEKWEMDYKDSGGSVAFNFNDPNKYQTDDEMISQLKEGIKTYTGVLRRAEDPDLAYALTPGEVEARNVEARKNMKPLSRSEVPPWETIDVDERDILPTRPDSFATINTPLSTGPRVEHAVPTEADNPNSIINMVYNTDDSVPMAPLNAPNKKWTGGVLAKEMDKEAKAAGRQITEFNDTTKAQIADTIANEAVAALGREGNASGWYNAKITEMNEVLQQIHPEMTPGSTNDGMFKLGLALTSNGSTVDYNFRAAEYVYRSFKDTGKFPTDLKGMASEVGGFGQEADALLTSFKRANKLIDASGPDKFVEFLNTEFTAKELKELGFKISKEKVDYKTHGSAIFGPKIGAGFYQNLNGNFTPVTFDRWWARSWGRWTGNSLVKTTKQSRQKQLERFRKASKSTVNSDRALIAQATKLFKAYEKGGFKDKTELNRAAQRLAVGAKDQMVMDPGNGTTRAFMRETTNLALEKLREMGYDLTPADLQATVWYPEKELHGKFGVGGGRIAPDDYAAAAYRLMENANGR